MPKNPRSFDKPPKSIDELSSLLIERGLIVDDIERLKRYLTFIGYYRFSAYTKPFQNSPNHQFKENTNFNDVLNLYIFDRRLRLLVIDAIERVEVGVRAVISDFLSRGYNAFWYKEKGLFRETFRDEHGKLLEEIKDRIGHNNERARSPHIRHYYNTYTSPDTPPSWMVFEELPFGMVSRIFRNLNKSYKKKIASYFGEDFMIFESWLHAIAYLRNISAHHSRLWNRVFTIKPKIPKNIKVHVPRNDRFYAQAVVLQRLLNKVSRRTQWKSRLNDLITEYPSISLNSMGFPNNWINLPPWSDQQ